MANIFPSTRIRRTHFSDGVEKAGVKGYTVYNHMLLPTNFGNLQDECIHLKNYVQIWDVAVERQVSVTGKDTQKLLNLISPRDLSKMSDDHRPMHSIPHADQCATQSTSGGQAPSPARQAAVAPSGASHGAPAPETAVDTE